MAKDKDEGEGGSLVLAVDCADCDAEAIELSVRMAARERRSLVLVTIERSSWADAANLPMTQLVRGHDLAAEAVDRAGMDRMLRHWSARTESVVSAVAKQHGVPIRLERRRGRLLQALAEAVGPHDWLNLILPASVGEIRDDLKGIAAQLREVGFPLMVSSKQRRGRRPVVLVYEGSAAALERALLLASLRGSALVVWATEDVDSAPVRALAEAHGIPVSLEIVKADDLGNRLAEAEAAVIVLDRQGPAGRRIDLAGVMQRRAASDLFVL